MRVQDGSRFSMYSGFILCGEAKVKTKAALRSKKINILDCKEVFIDSGARIPACHPLLCIQHSLYRYTCIVHLSPIHSLNTNDSLIAFITRVWSFV